MTRMLGEPSLFERLKDIARGVLFTLLLLVFALLLLAMFFAPVLPTMLRRWWLLG